MVVYCTGYKVTFPFLDDEVRAPPRTTTSTSTAAWSRPDHPGLYFIGLIQPLGAIMPLAEEQSHWVAELVTGEVALPPVAEMRAQIAAYDDGAAQAVRRLEAAHHPGRRPRLPGRAPQGAQGPAGLSACASLAAVGVGAG